MAPGAIGEATATCFGGPGASSATGGGGYFSDASPGLLQTNPIVDASAGLLQTNPIVSSDPIEPSAGVSALPADGQTANGWDAAAYNNTLAPQTFSVYVVCG